MSCCTPSRVGSAIAPGSSGAGACPLRQVQRCRKRRPEGHSMPRRFEPKLSILPAAQREVWPLLAPAPRLRLVLYGGTAVALQLGHRESLDFDFFCSAPLDKEDVR